MIAGAVFCRFCHHKVKNEGKMQKRHNDRYRYFKEEAATAEKYFIPYISRFAAVEGSKVLEAGCGEGGNLLPFARMGCSVTGVDVSELRISQASDFFSREGIGGKFVCADILDYDAGDRRFDIIILHDVIEHVACKSALLARLRRLLAPGGVVFVAFPAWMMPFGGHQQIARSRVVSHAPFVHLLPSGWYRRLLVMSGEDGFTVNELMSIRKTRQTVEGLTVWRVAQASKCKTGSCGLSILITTSSSAFAPSGCAACCQAFHTLGTSWLRHVFICFPIDGLLPCKRPSIAS